MCLGFILGMSCSKNYFDHCMLLHVGQICEPGCNTKRKQTLIRITVERVRALRMHFFPFPNKFQIFPGEQGPEPHSALSRHSYASFYRPPLQKPLRGP